MKIISKFKDYYDYLQGIYGIDNFKVYKRNKIVKEAEISLQFEEEKWRARKPHFFYSFAINNKIYLMVKTEKGIFEVSKQILKDIGYHKYGIDGILKNIGKPTNVNKHTRKPVIVGVGILGNYDSWSVYSKEWKIDSDPYLKSFSFHKVLSAHDIYIEVESFLGWMKDHPEIPNKQSNAEKLLAKGFDKKISFRHRKNKN